MGGSDSFRSPFRDIEGITIKMIVEIYILPIIAQKNKYAGYELYLCGRADVINN